MTIMEKVVTVAVTNLLLLIVCLLIASGKLDNVFTIAYGKSPLQKKIKAPAECFSCRFHSPSLHGVRLRSGVS